MPTLYQVRCWGTKKKEIKKHDFNEHTIMCSWQGQRDKMTDIAAQKIADSNMGTFISLEEDKEGVESNGVGFLEEVSIYVRLKW